MATAVNVHKMEQQAKLEVADIIRLHRESYAAQYPLPTSHRRVIGAIVSCRTAALGGHLEHCEQRGFSRPAYNSCRDRHCPKCQTLAKVRWLHARKTELLPVPYFHNVFTLPHELNPIILANKRLLLAMLFNCAAQTLLSFGARNLGGKLGFTMVLHTWDQALNAHFHVHCAIPAGALSTGNQYWIAANPRFLFSVRALSKVFRGKFLQALRESHDRGDLRWDDQEDLARRLAQIRRKEWIVYSKRPFAGQEQVLDYLGRYTHRVAISNHRIVNPIRILLEGPSSARSDGGGTDGLNLKDLPLLEEHMVAN